MVDDLHVAVLLNPKLTHDDIVHAACGVCPGVGFVVSAEPNARSQSGVKAGTAQAEEALTWAAPA